MLYRGYYIDAKGIWGMSESVFIVVLAFLRDEYNLRRIPGRFTDYTNIL